MQKQTSKHSFVHDAWTSDSGVPYLNVTTNFIRSPPGRPNDWELVTAALAFMRLKGRHTGKNLGQCILEVLQRYRLRGKVGWITADGAQVNRTAARTVEVGLDMEDLDWTADEHDMLYVVTSI